MRVMVTGASGFLGHHVTQRLLQAGHHVIGLDVGPPDDACQEWLFADITKPLAPCRLDAVVHLAAIANPGACDRDPTKAFDVNVNGTNQVLHMAVESGARKVVFSSSAHVYGISPRYLPTDESHPLWLQNTYTLTKILGEQLCHLYYENHGLSSITLRLFNAYGPGQLPGYFIPDQIAKAQSGRMTLEGSDVTKDWVYVDDVADAFVRALGSAFVGAVNIGTGVETSLSTIAGAIAKHYGAKLMGVPAQHPTRMLADARRARMSLGWYPEVGLEAGLAFTLRAAPVKPLALAR